MSRTAVIALASVFAAAALPASAALLWDSPGTSFPCGGGCWATGGAGTNAFRTWDNFTVAQDAQVTSATWRVAIFDGVGPVDPITTAWDIGFYADAAGAPGAALYTANPALADVTRTFLGTGIFQQVEVRYFEYAFDFATPFAAEAGATYWFSPFSIQPTYSPIYAWSGSVMAGSNSFQRNLSNGDEFYRTNNRAFSLSGSVPEPGTWALMIGGFGMAGAALRRRRGARVA